MKKYIFILILLQSIYTAVNAQITYSFDSDTVYIKNYKKSNEYKVLKQNGCLIRPKFKNPKIEVLKTAFIIECSDSLKYANKKFIKEKLKGYDILQIPKVIPLEVNNSFTSNDPKHNGTTGIDEGYHLDVIKARAAWSITKGDPNVIIGIIDSDFEPSHEDMQNKFIRVENPSVNNWHGIKVSGIIGANTNNGIGISGVAYNCRLDGRSFYFNFDIHDVINELFNDGVRIVNLSMASTGLTRVQAQAFVNNGMTLIVGSYFDCFNTTNFSGYNTSSASVGCQSGFSRYYNHYDLENLPGVIIVGRVNRNGEADGANRASETVCAVGTTIQSTIYMNSTCSGGYSMGYCWTGDNSIATAQVSGVVGLIRSVNPCLSPQEIYQIITTTSTPITNVGGGYRAGTINAHAAVQEALNRTSILNTAFFQSTMLYTNHSHTFAFFKIGSNVTPNAGYGPVSVAQGNSVTLTAREVTIKNDFEVPIGAEFTVNINPILPVDCEN